MKPHKLSCKVNGKWWTFGRICQSKGKYQNWQASFKVTPELVRLVQENEGKWINFSMFEDDGERKHSEAKGNAYQPQPDLGGDEVPF